MKEKEAACLALGLVTGTYLAAAVCLGCLVNRDWFLLFAPIVVFGGVFLIMWIPEALGK